jgi:hypothetical protein
LRQAPARLIIIDAANNGLRENMMFRLNLGSGASAFEVEGEADQVRSITHDELVARKWPAEMVKNIQQYQERLKRSRTEAQAIADASETGLFGTIADDKSD